MKMAVPVFIKDQWVATKPVAAFRFYLYLSRKCSKQLSFEAFMKSKEIEIEDVIFAPRELRPIALPKVNIQKKVKKG